MAFARGTVAARPSTSGAVAGARRALAAPAGPSFHARERTRKCLLNQVHFVLFLCSLAALLCSALLSPSGAAKKKKKEFQASQCSGPLAPALCSSRALLLLCRLFRIAMALLRARSRRKSSRFRAGLGDDRGARFGKRKRERERDRSPRQKESESDEEPVVSTPLFEPPPEGTALALLPI